MEATPGKESVAEDAWRRIFDFVMATVRHRSRILARLSLTPNDARALGSLHPKAGRTMRSLADEWECDASTATWIIDRLETKGIARRHAHPTDRRIRLVVLTTAGQRTKTKLQADGYRPPPELLELELADLIALRDAAAKLPGPSRPGR